MRYALRATDPTDQKTKETTQHGANRLAAVGLAALTVVPERRGARMVRLEMLGGGRDAAGAFAFTWPIWRRPIGLTAIRALLGHPGLDACRYPPRAQRRRSPARPPHHGRSVHELHASHVAGRLTVPFCSRRSRDAQGKKSYQGARVLRNPGAPEARLGSFLTSGRVGTEKLKVEYLHCLPPVC